MTQDKLLHAFFGLMIVLFLSGLGISPYAAMVVACIVGAAKEVYDYFNPDTHTDDWGDLLATMAGGFAGVLILQVVT